MFVQFMKEGTNEVMYEDTVLFIIKNSTAEKVEDTDTSFVEDDTLTPTNEDTTVVGGGEVEGSNTVPATQTPGERTEQTVQIPNDDTAIENGKADLLVRIIETGILDSDTNEFIQTDSMTYTSRGGVFFEVINLGTKTSEEWMFTAVLPTFPAYTFNSETQEKLAPGDRIEFTLGFDSVVQEIEGTILITVDPNNTLDEVTRDNNIAEITIQIILEPEVVE